MCGNPYKTYDQHATKLDQFIDFLMKWNRAFGFSKFKGVDEIRENLVIQSIAIGSFELLKRNLNLLDLGSGPGIPGLPLAITRPDLNITLMESSSRAVEFMNLCIKDLAIDNCNVLDGRAEKLAHVKGLRGEFDLALARSFAPVALVVEIGTAFLKEGGSILIQSTQQTSEQLTSNPPVIKSLSCERKQDNEAVIDPDRERILTFLTFTKTGTTPEKYPRAWKKMKSEPLF